MKIIGKAICIAASIMMASPVPSYAATAKKSAKATTVKVAKKATKQTAKKTATKTAKKGLNYKKVKIIVGKKVTLKLVGIKGKAKWTTSNKKVATVTSKGVVKGNKAGTAKIKATVNKKTYTCTVTVKNAAKKATTKKATKKTAIKTVKKGLNYKATITAGETLTLKLTGLKGYYVSWGTTNPHIVTVNDGDRNYASIGKKGVVKGVKAGTAKIFAVAGKKSAGKIYYECTFTVKEGKKKPVKPKPTKYSLFTPEQKAAYWAAEKADKDAIIKASADPTSEETCDSMEYMEDVWLSDNTKIVTKNTPGIPKFCKMQMVAGKQYIDITNASKENSIKIIDGHKNENGIYERYAYIYIHFNGHIYRMMNYRDRRDPSVKYIWDANNWNPGAHIKQYVKINKVIY